MAHALRREMNLELAREGITYRQWEVLVCLAFGDTTQTEIANRLGIEAPTLVGVLERMERDGWLERTGCPEDRRKKRIAPTRQASAVWNRMVACAHRVRARAQQGLSANDVATLKRISDQILRNLSADDPVAEGCQSTESGSCAAGTPGGSTTDSECSPWNSAAPPPAFETAPSLSLNNSVLKHE
ncbi:MAG: MarR family winged helix-turn-helix transcriptional regulator [Planctomycetaceae bacterium]